MSKSPKKEPKDNSQQNSPALRSSVYQFFDIKSKQDKYAFCRQCNKAVSRGDKDFNTTNLWKHLEKCSRRKDSIKKEPTYTQDLPRSTEAIQPSLGSQSSQPLIPVPQFQEANPRPPLSQGVIAPPLTQDSTCINSALSLSLPQSTTLQRSLSSPSTSRHVIFTFQPSKNKVTSSQSKWPADSPKKIEKSKYRIGISYRTYRSIEHLVYFLKIS